MTHSIKYCIVNNTVTLFNMKAPSGCDTRFFNEHRSISFLIELSGIENNWTTHKNLVTLNEDIEELCLRWFYEAGN